MKLRALRQKINKEVHLEPGQIYEQDDRNAIYEIESGCAAPAPEADLIPFVPDLPRGELSLREVYLHHVQDYPDLVGPLKDSGRSVQATGHLWLGHYRTAPRCQWQLPEHVRGTRSGFVSRVTGEAWFPSADEYWGEIPRRSPSTQERLARATLDVTYMSAIYFFVQRLVAAELSASGIWEEDLKGLKRAEIAKAWWQRDCVIDLGADTLFERVQSDRDNKHGLVRRWSDIRVWQTEPVMIAARDLPEPIESDPDFRAGRPSQRDRILLAYDSLISRGVDLSVKSTKEIAVAIRAEASVPANAKGFSDDTIAAHLKGRWSRGS